MYRRRKPTLPPPSWRGWAVPRQDGAAAEGPFRTGVRRGVPAPAPAADRVVQALQLARSYWGTGGVRSADDFQSQLRALELRKDQLHELRLALPVSATGPTGDRAREINRFCKALQAQARR